MLWGHHVFYLLLLQLVEVFLVGAAAAGELDDAPAGVHVEAPLQRRRHQTPGVQFNRHLVLGHYKFKHVSKLQI